MATFVTHERNLEIKQGSTFDDFVTWKTGATSETATPVDLTGCTARTQFRAKHDSPTVLLELTTANGGMELGGTAGTVRWLISAEDTADITWTTAVYDTEIVFADGTVQRKFAGKVKVSKEVTR